MPRFRRTVTAVGGIQLLGPNFNGSSECGPRAVNMRTYGTSSVN